MDKCSSAIGSAQFLVFALAGNNEPFAFTVVDYM